MKAAHPRQKDAPFRAGPAIILLLSGLALLLGAATASRAQSAQWDALLSNTSWYVPVPGLVAQVAVNSASFTSPPPVTAGDQTLWSLGPVVNGTLSGTSTAAMYINPEYVTKAPSAVIASRTLMSGTVADDGTVRIVFTDPSGGGTTLGVGNLRFADGVPLMEMQMITGTGLLLTHWAYMTPYNPATFTPPAPSQVTTAANTSPQWAWTAGTPWRITSASLFGSNRPGNIIITRYGNGYFLGQGVGPAGSPGQYFTILGSITPQGSVLFNTINAGTLNSLLGEIAGNPFGASMALAGYGFSGNDFSNAATLSLVAPYRNALLANGNPAALGAAASLYALAGTEAGLLGPMSPALGILNSLDGAALSSAVSQTLPVLNGAGSQATANTHRTFSQLVRVRQNALAGLGAGEEIIGNKSVWGTAFGRWSTQGNVDNVAGYNANTYGIAGGADFAMSGRSNLGAAFAVGNSLVTSTDSAAPSNLNITSYQLGAYGDYAVTDSFSLNFQGDLGLNANTGSRSVNFIGSTAKSNYYSFSWHAGTGLKRTCALDGKTLLTPSVRLDYLGVQSPSYQETGAGVLNLKVNEQTYRELFASLDLRLDRELTPAMKVSANAGAGYNMIPNQAKITASFAGGGDAFVTNGLAVSPWLYHAGLGFSGMLRKNLELLVRYDIQASPTSYLSQSASARLKFTF
ncbi:MAG: autotransporter outer membrane beta-barrel domain-containing protein [Acidobacteriota bacterium]